MQGSGWLAGLGLGGALALVAAGCLVLAMTGGPDTGVQRAALEVPLQGLKSVARTSTDLADEARAALEASDEAVRRYRQTVARQQRYLAAGSALAAISLLTVVAFSLGFTRATRRRSEKAVEAHEQRSRRHTLYILDELDRLANGDLHSRARDFDGDDVIVQAVDEVADSLGRQFGNARKAATTLTHRAAAAKTEMSTASTAVDRYIDISGDVATAVGDLLAGNDQLSSEVASCTAACQQLGEVVGRVGEAVRATMTASQRLREDNWHTAEQAERVQGGARELKGIVETVDDLANQAEVLALNAAIQESSAHSPTDGLVRLANDVHRLADRSRRVLERVLYWVTPDAGPIEGGADTTGEEGSGSLLAAPPVADWEEAVKDLEQLAPVLVEHFHACVRQWQAQALRIEALSREGATVQEAAARARALQATLAGSVEDVARFAQDVEQLLAGFDLPEEVGDNVVDIRPDSSRDASTITNPPLLHHVEIHAETG